MTRRGLNAVGRWLIRVSGLRVVRVAIEPFGDRYAEGYADGLARRPTAPSGRGGSRYAPGLRIVDQDSPA